MSEDAVYEGIPRQAIRFWGLNSLFWAHMKVFVKDVLESTEYSDYKGVYCYANTHPIVSVEILGYIVSMDVREKLITYGVDDGTGTISCCQWQPNDESKREQYDLGQLVTVQGNISVFRSQRQLTIDLIHLELDPNAEVLFWLEAVQLGSTEYKQPFDLPQTVFHGGVTSVSDLSKEEELKRAIVLHIKENKIMAFQFRTFCLEPDIQQLAREAVKQKYAEKIQGNKPDGSYEATKVIRQVVKDLEREGVVYFKDSKTDLYEVICHDHNLGSAIIKAIRKLSVPSGFPVSVWAIMDILHSSHKFHYVTSHQVEESLDKLLQSSKVYRQNEHEYCLV